MKRLLIGALMLSSSASAYEFTQNADAETYQMTGALYAVLEGHANNSMLCKSHPTPKINKALSEWRLIERSVGRWYQGEFDVGVAQGREVLRQGIAKLDEPMTREQCKAVDVSYSNQSNSIINTMKQAYILK